MFSCSVAYTSTSILLNNVVCLHWKDSETTVNFNKIQYTDSLNPEERYNSLGNPGKLRR